MASIIYLLPCPQCQHALELQKRQAGQTVSCPQCDHPFEAPRLGEFKRLQQSTIHNDAKSEHGSTSMLKRWLFTVGLAMTVLLGAAGVGVYQFANSIQREIDTDGAWEAYKADIDGLSDAEVYQVAAEYSSQDTIGEYFQPDLVKSNIQGEILKYIAYGTLSLAGVGLLMLVSSFVVK